MKIPLLTSSSAEESVEKGQQELKDFVVNGIKPYEIYELGNIGGLSFKNGHKNDLFKAVLISLHPK